MRTLRLSILLAAVAAGVPSAQAKLTVHEWGTFTVLQAPDGSTLTWYLGQNDATPLPKFVTEIPGIRPAYIGGKTGTANVISAIRMETPVLYFYPDAPMDVKVKVDFPGGSITESYPHGSGSGRTGFSWQGSLLPVTREALKTVPNADGPAGRHYAAAREVPEAWLFRKTTPPAAPAAAVPPPDSAVPLVGLLPPPAVTNPVSASVPAAETDHFIFYRGAGNNVSRVITVATGDDHSYQLTNRTQEAVPVLFLLRVTDGKSAWKQVDSLAPYKMTIEPDEKSAMQVKETGRQQVSLPDATEPLATSTAGLKAAMLTALEKEGLTKPEAAAMVATWDNLWFEERGTRMLAVLPQPWVDAVLPLEITPKPEAVERVFVARQELISVAQQNELVNLLTKAGDDPAAAREQLKKLELGRFARGFLDRAVTVKTNEIAGQMHTRFFELNNPPPAPAKATPVVGKTP